MGQNTEKCNIPNKDLERIQEKNSWKNARKLEDIEAAQYITIEKIYEIISQLDNMRDRCLATILYLTGARIEEIVRHRKIRFGKKRHEKIPGKWINDYTQKKIIGSYLGLRKKDILFEENDERDSVVFRIRNLKNKSKADKRKKLPVPMDKKEYEPFLKTIEIYYNTIIDDNQELFPISSRMAEKIISKMTIEDNGNLIKLHPHFLRKLRLTHLVTHHNFNEQHLIIFAGWTDGRPAKHYIRLGHRDLLKLM